MFIFWIKKTVFGSNVFHYEKLLSLDAAIVEIRGCVGNSLTVYCGGTWFDYRNLNQTFLDRSRKILKYSLRIGHHRLLPHTVQFISENYLSHSTSYNICS
jgi:hypothetical protein